MTTSVLIQRIAMALLALVTGAFGLVACGGNETADQAATDDAVTQADTTAPAQVVVEAVPTTEPAVVDPAPTAAFAASAAAEPDTGLEASADQVDTATDSAAASAAQSTAAAVSAARWSSNVSIEMEAGSFRFVSDGLPSHELPDQFLIPNTGNMPPFSGDDIANDFSIVNTSDLISASPLNVEITLSPVYSEEITRTSLSTIGVMISGVPLFNDYEDMNFEFVALDDNLSLDGVYFIDACNGHPLASGQSYHYHGVPYCVTDVVDVPGEHSTVIGVLLDGFPVYGPNDVGGVTMTNADLDECSGHFGPTPEFPEGIYHYHLTEDANPYSIDCFHGEIDYSGGGGPGGAPPGGGAGGERPDGPPPEGGEGAPPPDGAPAGGGPGGGGPDFAAAALTLGVTEDELRSALGGPPPDFAAAAAALNIDQATLQAALSAAGG